MNEKIDSFVTYLYSDDQDDRLDCDAASMLQELQSRLEELNRKVAELENEMQEQCRIIGMSAERELSLISKIKSLEKENSELKSDVKIKYWQRNGIGCTAMKANKQ